MRNRKIPLFAAALSAAWCGAAFADEASEKALQKQVDELRRQVEDLSRKVSDGTNRGSDELEQRIAELEKVSKKDQDGLFAYWKNGLKLDSVDGAFKLSVFGRLQNDWVGFSSKEEVTDTLGETVAGTEFRRARIGVGGTIYKNVAYKYEMDFAGGTAANWADAYMELKDPMPSLLPVNFRVGRFDEPMGLDRVTSSKYGTFMERGLQETFVPARNTGFMAYGPVPGVLNNQLEWFAGFFRPTNGNGDDLPSNTGDLPAAVPGTVAGRATAENTDNDNRGEHDLTFRVAGRPWINEDGSQFVHAGFSYMHRLPADEKVQYRTRPEIHQGPNFVDTGVMTGIDNVDVWGLEGGGNFGPFHFAAEWMRSELNGVSGRNSNGVMNADQSDLAFNARSIQVGFFVTGEQREYDVPMARWDRVKVRKNFGADGMGALEVALRYSRLDLNSGDTTKDGHDGGDLEDWTFGVNWYLNPNTRIMLNLIRAERTDLDLPAVTAVGLRFAIDF